MMAASWSRHLWRIRDVADKGDDLSYRNAMLPGLAIIEPDGRRVDVSTTRKTLDAVAGVYCSWMREPMP